MSQNLLDVAKGCEAMNYEQYVTLLKVKAHDLENSSENSGGGRSSRYQRTINRGERDGKSGRGDGRNNGRFGRGGGREGRVEAVETAKARKLVFS